MPNFEKLQLPIEPEVTPEDIKALIDERDSLSKKLADFDAKLAEITKRKSENIPSLESDNTYNQHLADREKLGQIVGETAQALSPENLQKIYEKNVPPAVEPVVKPDQEPVVETPVPPPVAPSARPEPAPVQKTPAQLLAEKIRNLDKTGETLSVEDVELRTKNWPAVEKALIELSQPVSIDHENTIEAGTPTLERITSDYAEMLFTNKSSLRNNTETTNPLIVDAVKKASSDYHTACLTETQKLHESHAGIKEVISFYKKQSLQLNKELMRRESPTIRERVAKSQIPSKMIAGVGIALLYTIVFGVESVKGIWNKGGELAQKGFQKIKAEWNAAPSSAKTIKEKLMERFQLGVPKDDPEKTSQKNNPTKKFSLASKFGSAPTKTPPTPQNPNLEKILLEKNIKQRSSEFLKKVFDTKPENEVVHDWGKLQKVPVRYFFDPHLMKWELADYNPEEKTIYEKLLSTYRTHQEAKDFKMTNLTLGEFINKLAEQDKLKDLWNQPSTNNS